MYKNYVCKSRMLYKKSHSVKINKFDFSKTMIWASLMRSKEGSRKVRICQNNKRKS